MYESSVLFPENIVVVCVCCGLVCMQFWYFVDVDIVIMVWITSLEMIRDHVLGFGIGNVDEHLETCL